MQSVMAEILKKELFQSPSSFSYIQAIRLLLSEDAAFGEAKKRIRSRATLSLGFTASDIRTLLEKGDVVELTVNFFGLYGLSSPLPAFYSEELIAENNEDENVLRDFCDMITELFFQHYYAVWQKNHILSLFVEKNSRPTVNPVFSLLGYDNDSVVPEKESICYEALPYISLYTQLPRSAQNLKLLVKAIISPLCDVDIYQWVPMWVDIPPEQYCILGVSGHYLGEESYIGSQILDYSNNLTIAITTSDYDVFRELLPKRHSYEKLHRLLTHFIHGYLNLFLNITLNEKVSASPVLGSEYRTILGIDSCLGGEKLTSNLPLISHEQNTF